MSWIHRWKNNKTKCKWKHLTHACDVLSEQLAKQNITKIVGLARGGLVPATLLANSLCVREVFSIGLASYELTAEGIEQSGELNVYQQLRFDGKTRIAPGDIVLIVDDISDQGHTLNRARDMVRSMDVCDVQTLAIYTKPETKHVPDYFYKTIAQDCWVVFPWEK